MPLSPEDKKELDDALREARRIIREDRILQSHAHIRAKLDKHFPDEPEPPEGTPPAPEVRPPADPTSDKKKGGWWGDAISD